MRLLTLDLDTVVTRLHALNAAGWARFRITGDIVELAILEQDSPTANRRNVHLDDSKSV